MRRFSLILLSAALAAATLATGALAKEGGVELSSAPHGLGAGDQWTTELRIVDESPDFLAQAKPRIEISNEKGLRESFPAAPTETPGVYTVDVVFPEKGFWTYEAFDGVTGRAFEYPQVYIDGPAVAAPTSGTPAGDTDPFPVWPFVGGGIAFALLVLAAALTIRHRRPVEQA